MSDRHTLSLDYQIAQARRLKRLEAENSRLRALMAQHRIPAPAPHTEVQTDLERSWLAQEEDAGDAPALG